MSVQTLSIDSTHKISKISSVFPISSLITHRNKTRIPQAPPRPTPFTTAQLRSNTTALKMHAGEVREQQQHRRRKQASGLQIRADAKAQSSYTSCVRAGDRETLHHRSLRYRLSRDPVSSSGAAAPQHTSHTQTRARALGYIAIGFLDARGTLHRIPALTDGFCTACVCPRHPALCAPPPRRPRRLLISARI